MLLRRINTAAAVGVLVGLCVSAVTAEIHRESAPHRCVGCTTGRCQAGSPHGYWKPTWRRWPGATTYGGFRKPRPEIDVPVNQVPEALDEIRINARSRSEEPLEGDAAASPLLPEMTPSAPGETPFVPIPDTEPPAIDPDPLPETDPFDPTPAPPNDLFDDLMPPPMDPATTPDDNLFDDFGSAPEAASTPPRISKRVIRSRRPATLDAGISTSQERMPPPLGEPSIPSTHFVPSSQVAQASHHEAIDRHPPDQEAAAPPQARRPLPATAPYTNPLRPQQTPAPSAANTKTPPDVAARQPRVAAVPVSAHGSVQQSAVSNKRRLRKMREMNPLRQP